MKKNLKLVLVLLSVIGFFGLKECFALSGSVFKTGDYRFGNMHMNFYSTNIGGNNYMTYCLDAGLPYPSSNNYQTLHVIDPSTSTGAWFNYDVVTTVAYSILHERNLTSTTNDNRIIGTYLFRWIQETYMPRASGSGPELSGAKAIFRGLYPAVKGDPYAAIANEIFNEAVSVQQRVHNYSEFLEYTKSKGTFNQWEITEQTLKNTVDDVTFEMTFRMKPTSTIYNADYSGIRVLSSNPNITIFNELTKVEVLADGGAKVTVTFNSGAWDRKAPLGFSLNMNYCDPRSALSQLHLLHNPGKSSVGGSKGLPWQYMLVVLPGDQTSCSFGASITPPPPEIIIDEPNDVPEGHIGKYTCSCDNTTGIWNYVYKRDNKEVLNVSWREGDKTPDGVDTKYCTGSCPNPTPDKGCVYNEDKKEYTYTEKVNGKVTFSISWNENSQDSKENAIKYNCPFNGEKHSCEKPSSSNGNKYYCKESSPGKGDGAVCDEEQYNEDCLCDSLDPDSEEYAEKCLNCNATVSIPEKCLEFNTNGFLTDGSISDINKVSTECNKYKNQIKKCVLGKNDMTDKSYEATTELSDNPYCKVWCEEKYDFNLPAAQYSQSGGYFTLSTKISAERNCYTSGADDFTKPIDSEKFKTDLAKAQEEVIAAYNTYAKWKSAASISSTGVTLTCTFSGKSDSNSCGPNKNSSCGDSCSSGSNSGTGYKKSWSWLEYSINGTTTKKSDSYGPGSSTDGTCSCTVTPEANRDKDHKKKMEESKAVLVKKINALNDIISKYNSCSGVVGNESTSSLATNSPASTTVSSWSNTMLFDPKVKFSYDEDYIDKMSGEFKEVSRDSTNSTEMYCNGDIDNEYGCTTNSTSSIPTYDQSYMMCDENGCGIKTSKVSSAKWVRKTKSVSANYRPVENFSTATQYGTIRFGVREDGSKGYYLATNLPEHALPVQLRQKQGVFRFRFTFLNIGQSNQDGTLGRLIGNSTSVLTEFNKLSPSKKCGSIGEVSETTKGGYVCYYINNCDDCNIVCPDDSCDLPELEPPCPDCPLACKNCVYDGNGASYSYRTVSLNQLFPNERNVGYNWNESDNIKARISEHEISEAGENIYENPQYSIRLTSANLKAIRKYNDEAGSYVNAKTPLMINGSDDAVYCENMNVNGIDYSVRCKSRFLDLLESDKRYATSILRITSSDSSRGGMGADAWELFIEDENNKKYISKEDGIGPSWRIRSGN